MILSALAGCCVLCEACTLDFLDFLEECNVNAFRIINPACRIGACYNVNAHLLCLLDCIDRNIACTCHCSCLACDVDAVDLKKFFCQIKEAVTCSLCSCERAAVCKALTCQNTFIKACDSLILAIKETDFTSAYADIAGRYVCVSADMSVELCHETLAEPHDLIVGFTLRVEVGTALAAADRKTCEAVLEDLLEAKELDDAEIYGRMKSETSFVRSDRAVELNAIAAVHLYLAVIIYPRYAEHNDSLRLNESFQKCEIPVVLLIRFNDYTDRLENFLDCLDKFRLCSVLLLYTCDYLINI